MIDLSSLSQQDLRLVQAGLDKLSGIAVPLEIDGIYGPLTQAAYDQYYGVEESSSMGKLIAKIALAEVGVLEEPTNSNKGPRVQEYQAASWLEGTGWAYCAAFVDWCVREALERRGTRSAWERPETAGAWDLLNWAEDQQLPILDSRADLMEGDIVVYTWHHCGIVDTDCRSVEETFMTTEGNTTAEESSMESERDGGGVYARSRHRRQIKGVIRLT